MSATIVGIALGIIAAMATLGMPWEALTRLLQGYVPTLSDLSPVTSLVRIASDVVQAYAILAGLVVQLITLVTMVFNPGRLGVARIRRVADELEKMQSQLIGLFAIYVVTLAFALATKILAGSSDSPTFSTLAGPLCLAGTAFMVVFSLARTGVMGVSIMSVQRLRATLLVEQAKQDEDEAKASREARPPLEIEPDPTPEAYGTKRS